MTAAGCGLSWENTRPRRREAAQGDLPVFAGELADISRRCEPAWKCRAHAANSVKYMGGDEKIFVSKKRWKIVRECFFVVTKIFYGESSYEVKISYNPILNENSIFFPNHSRIRGEQSNRGPPFRVLVFQPLLPSYNRTQNLVEKQK